MSEVTVTLYGYVGQEVEFKQTSRGDVATFRVGTTPRYWKDGGYRDGETIWTQVTAWRTLAANVAASLNVGDPVVGVGRVRNQRWTTDQGEQRERSHVEAQTVAHDLAKGTSAFRKNPRTARRDEDDVEVREMLDRAADQAPVDIDPVTGEIRETAGRQSGDAAA
jgi:single-strand DNA-binding protein